MKLRRGIRTSIIRISALVSVGLSGCVGPAESPTPNLRQSLLKDPNWIILVRPTTHWKPGDVIDISSKGTQRGDPQPEGNFATRCLPTNVWKSTTTKYSPTVNLTSSFGYDVDLNAVLKIPQLQSASASLTPAGEAKKIVKIGKYSETISDVSSVKGWLLEKKGEHINARQIGFLCKSYLFSPEYKIIGDTFNVTDGEILSRNSFGKTENDRLFTWRSEGVLDKIANLNASLDVSRLKEGRIVIKESKLPMVMAIRTADLTKQLLQFEKDSNMFGLFGVDTSQPLDASPSLQQILRNSGAALKD